MPNPISTPAGYRPYDADTLADYLVTVPAVVERLGGVPPTWRIEEVGDGNLNLVFIVHGPAGGVAVKQALPYVRLVGESWPLPLSRAHYEQMALCHEARHAPGLVPELVYYDEPLALIVMELLEPHIIMRQGMIKGIVYPRFVDDITTFMVGTLFHTSDLALPAARKKELIGDFSGNTALCKITEDLVFTDPYTFAENNRWTAPELDPYAKWIREDGDLKVAVSRLKIKFMSQAEALLHGDLHTGSVMVTQTDTRVIDPEFAFMGPIGFDVGAIIANLLLNYFAQIGHEDPPGARDPYRNWILGIVISVWTEFRRKFIELWQSQVSGDGYPQNLFQDTHGAIRLAAEREAYLDRLFQDTLGFAAAKMIRRILGLAHNIDFEWIENPRTRASAEARALTLARELMVNSCAYRTIDTVVAAARRHNAWVPELRT